MSWNVRIAKNKDGFVIQMSVNHMRHYVTQFKYSFSLHGEEFDNPRRMRITDTYTDSSIELGYEGGSIHSILFGNVDDTIVCMLQGEPTKMNDLATYLLDILETYTLPKSSFSINIPAILPSLSTKSRKDRTSRHANLRNSDLENITELNVSGPNWRIGMGNKANESIPIALTPSPKRTRRRKRKS